MSPVEFGESGNAFVELSVPPFVREHFLWSGNPHILTALNYFDGIPLDYLLNGF